MKNPIQNIIDFNVKAGFIKPDVNTFKDTNESAYLIEEALEPYNVDFLAKTLSVNTNSEKYDKNPQREVAKALMANVDAPDFIPSIDLFDKYLDAIVYAVGALGKLGLSHQDITAGLNIVTEANLKKTLNPTYDELGKLMKPANWKEIEDEQYYKLCKILEKKGIE